MSTSPFGDVGVVHPGSMGVTVAACAAASGARVWWCSEGRSPTTAGRAKEVGLSAVASLAALVDRCDVIVAVCPPDAALAVASAVAELGFDGVYVEANAIAPQTTRQIAERFERFVDGGIVGPPALEPGTTRLYLAGGESAAVAGLFAGSVLEAIELGGAVGAASALKMAYAAWTKVPAALLLAVRALAAAEGVDAELVAEWERSQPGLVERSTTTAAAMAPKAWRWAGEMREIERSFAAAGLPLGFGAAAAELYERLVAFRDGRVDLGTVLAALRP